MSTAVLSAVRGITFDLDDSLWAVWPVIHRAEAKMHEHLAEHYPRIAERYDVASVRDLRNRVAEAHPQLAYDFTEMRRLTYVELLTGAGYAADGADDLLARFLDLRHEVTFFDDVLPALEALAARYRLYAVSNGNASLARVGIDHLFHGQVNAGMVGAGKPDARIFHVACAELDLDPGQVLHIGDHPLEDIHGAMSAGLRAAWLNRTEATWPREDAPDLTITRLDQLVEALQAAEG